MLYGDSDDPEYNPFAEAGSGIHDPSASGSNLVQTSYSSAFFPNSNSRPTLRRRRSSLSVKLSFNGDGGPPKHARSFTDIEIPPYSAGLHPLKTALAGINGADFEDLGGVTRPHLLRVVNDANLGDASSPDRELSREPSPSQEQEKEVIVHQVTSKDSLAGVALKYGISMPNLRRANKLWATDSIHLRDVLYIPIEQASRACEYIPEQNLISLTSEMRDTSEDPYDQLSSPIFMGSSGSVPQSPSVPVQKIPVKQLSFFPPSSHKNTQSPTMNPGKRSDRHVHSHGNFRLSPGSNKYSPSHVNNSLSSILTALPINASTRDEIITRLSFDSVSSSFTDQSRANSDEEVGHELTEVAKINGHHNRGEEMDELSMPTPKASQPPDMLPRRTDPRVTESSSLPRTSHMHGYSSTSPPRFYVSQVHETSVRTSQLEPSPAMQLPLRSGNISRLAGKNVQSDAKPDRLSKGPSSNYIDFELEINHDALK